MNKQIRYVIAMDINDSGFLLYLKHIGKPYFMYAWIRDVHLANQYIDEDGALALAERWQTYPNVEVKKVTMTTEVN